MENDTSVRIDTDIYKEYIITIKETIRLYFTLIRSNQPVVKTYLSDGSKRTGANIWKATYYMQVVDSLLEFDKYLNDSTMYDTISLGITEKTSGDLVTNAKLEQGTIGKNLISRSSRFIKFLNDTYKFYKESKDYSLYLFDIDYDEKSPSHFKLEKTEDIRTVLIKIAPMLEFVQMIIRPSSSSGIKNTVTGEYRNSTKSYHIYIIISNTNYIHHFTEYLKRRCWKTNYAYITINGAGVKDKYIFDDVVMKTSERLIVESLPITYPPYVKELEESTFYDGGILNLEMFENYCNEPDYKDKMDKQKQLIRGNIDLKPSSAKTKKNKSMIPINCTPLSTSNNTSIIISDETLKKFGFIYHYLKDTTYPKAEAVNKFIDEYVVKAILQFLGYTVEHNFMFKMRLNERTASASIQRKTALISDFGSDFRGNIYRFIMEISGLDFLTSFKYFQNLFIDKYEIQNKKGALRNPQEFQKCLQTLSITL